MCGGFGSCHGFVVAVAYVAMASANGVDENLFRLPCSGKLLDESLLVIRVYCTLSS
jgi:hypothetical protein